MARWGNFSKDASILGAIRSVCRYTNRGKNPPHTQGVSTSVEDVLVRTKSLGTSRSRTSRVGAAASSESLAMGQEDGRQGPLTGEHDGNTVYVTRPEHLWDEFEGIQVIGEGVYGRVYLVKSHKPVKHLAFKRIYLNSKTRDISAHQSREIEILRCLRGHPNIIELNKVYVVPPRAFLSFPYVKDGTLGSYITHYLTPANSSPASTDTDRDSNLSRMSTNDTGHHGDMDDDMSSLAIEPLARDSHSHDTLARGSLHTLHVQHECGRHQMPLTELKEVARQLLDGLAYIHSHNILHRDIKPDNILIDTHARTHKPQGGHMQTANGQDARMPPSKQPDLNRKARTSGDAPYNCDKGEKVSKYNTMPVIKHLYIADFGLARYVDDKMEGRPLSPEVVTLSYRPLELLLGLREYTTKIDIWSAGCILMEMLLGTEMFNSCNEFSLITEIFAAFGTPTQTEWPLLYNLPFMSPNLPKFKRSKPGPIYKKLLEHKRYDALQDPALIQLLESMLQPCPAHRIDAATALRHETFQTTPHH